MSARWWRSSNLRFWSSASGQAGMTVPRWRMSCGVEFCDAVDWTDEPLTLALSPCRGEGTSDFARGAILVSAVADFEVRRFVERVAAFAHPVGGPFEDLAE